MAVSSRKIVLTLLRIAICVAALWWVLASVKWHDYINLRDGSSAYLMKTQDDSYEIQTFDEQIKTISLDQVALNQDGDPEISYGLRSVVFDSQWIYFLYALLIYTPVTFIQAFRFRMVFRSQDIDLTYGESMKLCFAGNFLNFVALGSTGGDVVKAYYVCQKTHRKTEAITTLFLDRIIGLLGLLIAVGFSIVLFSQDVRLRVFGYMIAAILFVIAIGSIVMASNRVRRIWWKLIPGFARRIWESAHPETATVSSEKRTHSMFQWGMIQLRKVDQSAQRFLRHGGNAGSSNCTICYAPVCRSCSRTGSCPCTPHALGLEYGRRLFRLYWVR